MSLSFRAKLYLKNQLGQAGKAVLCAVGGFVGFLAFDTHVATIRRTEGPSMSPTLNALEYSERKFEERHRIFALREYNNNPDFVFCSRKFEPQRGDVVLVVDPKNSNQYLIKRIIGLEGDTVVPLGFNETRLPPVTLTRDQVWVESDAGYGYRDSNTFGPVTLSSLQGKALYAFNVMHFNIRSLVSEIPSEKQSRLTISDNLP